MRAAMHLRPVVRYRRAPLAERAWYALADWCEARWAHLQGAVLGVGATALLLWLARCWR